MPNYLMQLDELRNRLKRTETAHQVIEVLKDLVDTLIEDAHQTEYTLQHGDNRDCPQVQSGEWMYCKGHKMETLP